VQVRVKSNYKPTQPSTSGPSASERTKIIKNKRVLVQDFKQQKSGAQASLIYSPHVQPQVKPDLSARQN